MPFKTLGPIGPRAVGEIIRQGLFKTGHLQVCPKSAAFRRVFSKSEGLGPKVATGGGGGGGEGLGCHLVPPLLAGNCSSVALFFLINALPGMTQIGITYEK